MKKALLLSLAAISIFTSCSKNGNDANPTEEPNTAQTVAINGNIYSTIKIGSKTWTAVNYNGTGGLNYNSSTVNDANYGKLYTLEEAKAITLPAGWRLPTKDDYIDLMRNAGAVTTGLDAEMLIDGNAARKLRAKTSWAYQNGDNTLGFNALAAGDSFIFSSASGLQFDGKGDYTDFWTSTSATDTNDGNKTVKHQYVFELNNTKYSDNTVDDEGSVYNSSYATLSRFSIRFVKDN